MGLRFSIVLLALCGPGMALAAQTVAGGSDLPSATLQPSLDVLKQALSGVRTDKWKGSATVKGETDTNLASIRRDMESTLPPLLAAADAVPTSGAKLLPAYRNVEALYDVLLRVVAAGKLEAPSDQSSALDQALGKLDEGRRALGDRLQANSVAAEKKVNDLQVALKAVPPPVPPAPPVVCPPAPIKKKAKIVAKPAAPAAAATAPK
jgi:hypothetical protein